ncbi:glycosyltransferase [Kineococcus sp. NPDC059986]|uniref:glycosyltransferase n=1 Tax=Kineococcus sp. NPDC059986 TaxID=3155538 RepID=UPI00344CC18F
MLVVGAGAEGVHHRLGRALTGARAAGWNLLGVDHVVAAASRLKGEPGDIVAWTLETFAPVLVLVTDEVDPGQELPSGTETRSVDADVLVRALAELREPTGLLQAGDDGDVDGDPGDLAVAALQAVLAPLRPKGLQVHEYRPRASIVIACHNLDGYTHEVVRSSLEQTFDDFEVVVVDDGSTDRTAELLETYASNPKVRVVTQPNVGGTGRMDLVQNRLIRESRGELIAWIGGDDVNAPRRLEVQVQAFDDDPGLDVCHGAAYFIDEQSHLTGRGFRPPFPYDDMSMLRQIIHTNLVGAPSVMVRRSAMEQHGLFEQGLASDYHFWLKTAGILRYRYLPQVLVHYRRHAASLSTSTAGAERTIRDSMRLRSLVLASRPLEDFFPELRHAPGRAAETEASVALGNALLQIDAHLALQAYEVALGHGSADAFHNAAIAHVLAGEADAARASVRTAIQLDPLCSVLEDALSGRGDVQVGLRRPRGHLGGVVEAARNAWGGTVRRWDGTTLQTQRAYLGFVPGRDDLARGALEMWASRTHSSHCLRWVVPSVPGRAQETFDRLVAAAGGLDLADAADIAIEEVDDLGLLPPQEDPWSVLPGEGEQRLTGLLASEEALEVFTRWVSQAQWSSLQSGGEAWLPA